MQRGYPNHVGGHAPKAQQVSADFAVAGPQDFLLHFPQRPLFLAGGGMGLVILLVEVGRQNDFAHVVHQTRRVGLAAAFGIAGFHLRNGFGRVGDVGAVPPDGVNGKINRLHFVVLTQQLDGHDQRFDGFKSQDADGFGRVGDGARP